MPTKSVSPWMRECRAHRKPSPPSPKSSACPPPPQGVLPGEFASPLLTEDRALDVERPGDVAQDGVGGDLDPARFEAVAAAGEGFGLSERRGDQESGERDEGRERLESLLHSPP